MKAERQKVVEDKFTCPDCRLRAMIKIEVEETGFYMLRCEGCGAEIGPLPSKGIKNNIL